MNQTIVLTTEEISLVVEGKNPVLGTGTFSWQWLPSPAIILEANFSDFNGAHDAFMSPHSKVLAKNMSPIDFRGTSFSFGNECTIKGKLMGMFQPEQITDFKELKFCLPNFPDYYGSSITSDLNGETSHRAGRMTFKSDNWQVIIDNLPNTRQLINSLSDEGGYAITHTGVLTHIDGSPINLSKAQDFMQGLSYFLSFIAGYWTQPILWAGSFDDGKNYQIVTPSNQRLTDWRNIVSWSNMRSKEASIHIESFFPSFMQQFNTSPDVLRRAIGWYLEVLANDLVADARITLAQVSLELLAESIHSLYGKKMRGTAESRILGVLKLCVPSVSLAVPIGLPNLSNAIHRQPISTSVNKGASGVAEGPSVVVYIRNKIAHSARSSAEKSLLNDVMTMHEASQLILWYVELILLGWLKYTGKFRSRVVQSAWLGDGEDFPPTTGTLLPPSVATIAT